MAGWREPNYELYITVSIFLVLAIGLCYLFVTKRTEKRKQLEADFLNDRVDD